MNFDLDDTQLATCELAQKMLRDYSTPQRLLKLEDAEHRLDTELWAALKETGLTAIGIDPEHGGAGLGFSETCFVLEQVGTTVAAVPLLGHTVALQTLQHAKAFNALVKYVEDAGWIAASARMDGGNTLRHTDGGLVGTISAVPYAPGASAFLVPVKQDGSFHLYLVANGQSGIAIVKQAGTDKSLMGRLTLDAVPGTELGDEKLIDWMRQRLIAASCAVQTGVVEETVKMTAAYVSEREAFGVKIGTFQAVSQRMADTYIDAMALQLMSRNAASMLANHHDAAADVLAAKIMAGDVGHRVLASCQHVHGGMGHDRDYPLWRYAVAAKQNELAFASGGEATAELGVLIATRPESVSDGRERPKRI